MGCTVKITGQPFGIIKYRRCFYKELFKDCRKKKKISSTKTHYKMIINTVFCIPTGSRVHEIKTAILRQTTCHWTK
jgi:hypothetical protein